MRRLFSAGLFSSKPSSKSRRRAAGSASETSDDEVPGSGPSSSTASSSLGALGILEVSASESSSDDAEPVCIVGMDEIAATQPLATALAVALEGSSAAAARAACVDAVEVGRTTPDCARQLAACGAALTVLRILARWHAEEPVAEAAFAAVRFICSDDDASDVVLQIFLSRSDLLDEWLGAMQRFFSARQLQLHGVCVLGIHVKKSTKIAESLDRGPRVMRAMVFAMTSHRGDAEIQRVGAAALHFVARKSKWSTEVILGLGVTDVLRSAMEGHQVDGELQRCAIFALATLVKLSDKAVPALLRADISPTLLAAMSAYPSDVYLQRKACLIVAAIAKHSYAAADGLNVLGAGRVMHGVSKKLADDVVLQKTAKRALRRLKRAKMRRASERSKAKRAAEKAARKERKRSGSSRSSEERSSSGGDKESRRRRHHHRSDKKRGSSSSSSRKKKSSSSSSSSSSRRSSRRTKSALRGEVDDADDASTSGASVGGREYLPRDDASDTQSCASGDSFSYSEYSESQWEYSIGSSVDSSRTDATDDYTSDDFDMFAHQLDDLEAGVGGGGGGGKEGARPLPKPHPLATASLKDSWGAGALATPPLARRRSARAGGSLGWSAETPSPSPLQSRARGGWDEVDTPSPVVTRGLSRSNWEADTPPLTRRRGRSAPTVPTEQELESGDDVTSDGEESELTATSGGSTARQPTGADFGNPADSRELTISESSSDDD